MVSLRSLALFSIAYGGFLLAAYMLTTYFLLWRAEFLPFPGFRNLATRPDPAATLLSPLSFVWLFTGVAFIINGVLLLRHVRNQDIADTRSTTLVHLLTGDERRLFEELQKQGGSITQKELTLRTGFSPVKVHRALARLQTKHVLKVHPFGMTNKILLEK